MSEMHTDFFGNVVCNYGDWHSYGPCVLCERDDLLEWIERPLKWPGAKPMTKSIDDGEVHEWSVVVTCIGHKNLRCKGTRSQVEKDPFGYAFDNENELEEGGWEIAFMKKDD